MVSSSLAGPRLGGRVLSTSEMAAGGWEGAGSRWCPAATAKGHTSGRVCGDAWQAAASRALDLRKSKSNKTCWGEWECAKGVGKTGERVRGSLSLSAATAPQQLTLPRSNTTALGWLGPADRREEFVAAAAVAALVAAETGYCMQCLYMRDPTCALYCASKDRDTPCRRSYTPRWESPAGQHEQRAMRHSHIDERHDRRILDRHRAADKQRRGTCSADRSPCGPIALIVRSIVPLKAITVIVNAMQGLSAPAPTAFKAFGRRKPTVSRNRSVTSMASIEFQV